MAKKATSSIKKFIWQLKKIQMDAVFKSKIDMIINRNWDSARLTQNTLTIKSDYKTYTIELGNNIIKYHLYYTQETGPDNYTIDEIGKIYKCGENLITKYLESTITTRYDYQEATTKTTTSCFNGDLTETFKSIEINYQNYNEETGKKQLIQYEDRGNPIEKCNNLTTTKIRRTHSGNLIRIDEVTHYVDKQKKYDKKSYSIKKSNEPYIPYYDYTPVAEDVYIDYINFKIPEKELFKKRTK